LKAIQDCKAKKQELQFFHFCKHNQGNVPYAIMNINVPELIVATYLIKAILIRLT